MEHQSTQKCMVIIIMPMFQRYPLTELQKKIHLHQSLQEAGKHLQLHIPENIHLLTAMEIPKKLHLNRVKPLRYTTAQTKKKGENKCQI